MSSKYQEVIVCQNCLTKHYRNVEVLSIDNKLELDSPLKIIIIKKFECPNCKEDKEFSVDIEQIKAI